MFRYFKNIGFNEVVSSGSFLAKALAAAFWICFGAATGLAMLLLPQTWLGSIAGIFSFVALLPLLAGITFIL